MRIALTIDGRRIESFEGETILETARRHGLEIPTLCYHRDLSIDGSCRLCVVEVAGLPARAAACTMPVAEGMEIRTESESLAEERRLILEMLLADYVETDEDPDQREPTEFDRWVKFYGARRPDWARSERCYDVDGDPNPFVRVDFNKCILCTRCVRACEEIQGRFVWGVAQRGRETRIVAGADTTMLDARCESCGACVAYCPTTALDDRLSFRLGRPDKLVTTTCGYCGVGCQFDLNIKDDRVIRVTSNPDAPVNGMSLCVKGRYGYDFIDHPDRLRAPRVREYLLDQRTPASSRSRASAGDRGPWIETDWDTALDLIAGRLVEIGSESGPDALGVLASAKCSNEENYLMQKLARQVLGTHNVDHCARLCHSSTVAGLAMAFGSGAMSNSMDDVAAHAASMLIIGSNTTEQHPVFGAMIRQAVLRRGMKLVVADPRAIDITEFATMHLRQTPGTDVALLNGLMHVIVQAGLHDRKFIEERCEGFEEFRQTIEKYTPESVAATTGVPADKITEAARLLAANRPMAVVWAMGITQHTTGVLNVLSLANLQMLLGNMGVPGGGVNPLRGQNNVQGACDMGALPNVFPGYQSVTDAAVLERFDAAWKLEPVGRPSKAVRSAFEGRPAKPGLTVTEMIDAAGEGRIRGLYILGENPVMTDPDVGHVRRCLEKAKLVVLQEIFPSETSEYADVLLPGVSFAERTGTFTNTERRVQLFRQAISPRGQARPDWRVVCEVARRILERQGRRPSGPHAGWDYADPAAIMDEIAALTPSYAGVSHSRLERGERLQWPVPALGAGLPTSAKGPSAGLPEPAAPKRPSIAPSAGSGDPRSAPGTPILHIGKFNRDRGRFHAVDHLPAHELPDDEFPYLLTTGRVLYHWHGGEMTRRAKGLQEIYPHSLVEISPDDASRLAIADDEMVTVESRRGRVRAHAVVTTRLSPGVIFGNFHFPGEENINNLTIAALDPVAKIPEYKVCAVRLQAGIA